MDCRWTGGKALSFGIATLGETANMKGCSRKVRIIPMMGKERNDVKQLGLKVSRGDYQRRTWVREREKRELWCGKMTVTQHYCRLKGYWDGCGRGFKEKTHRTSQRRSRQSTRRGLHHSSALAVVTAGTGKRTESALRHCTFESRGS